jgi:hypothetical protein
MAYLSNEFIVNAKQVKSAEDLICIFLLCVFEIACTFSYYIAKPNDSNVLRNFVASSIPAAK